MSKLKNYSAMETILINYRWVFVVFFLLPLSFVYDICVFIRHKIIFLLKSAPKNHVKKVQKIQKQIAKWKKSGSTEKMCTGRPSWQTMSFRRSLYKKHMFQVDCNLFDILEIDKTKQIIRVEPLVTIGQITSTLYKEGLSLAIVPELEDLTIGGLVNGVGVEASSHKYGLFQHICISFEVVLSDGSLVKCSKTENPDLFHAIPWSHGTLGFLTAVEIKIIPATKFIKLKYELVRGLENIVNKLDSESKNLKNDFVEGIQYSLDEAVIMTANFVKDCDVSWWKFNQMGLWFKPWFFNHVRENFEGLETQCTEYIPTLDYYHRHSRSIFWEMQDIIPFGNHIYFRLLCGWMLPIKISLLKLTQVNAVKKLYEQNHFIQDLLVPMTSLKEFLEHSHQSVEIYPLWLCPFNLPNTPGMVHPKNNLSHEMYVDVGIYGVPKAEAYNPKDTTRYLEDIVTECNGFQMLHADTYRTREEFREMFDHTLYDQLREKLNCSNAFPEVYDKVNKNVRD